VPRLLADLPRTRARMGRGDFRELNHDAHPSRYPGYYAQNFHYQSEGYLGTPAPPSTTCRSSFSSAAPPTPCGGA